MIFEYVRYRIPEDRHVQFERALARAEFALSASPHCSSHELERGVEEPDRYILRVVWDSIEGHEQGFRGGADFERFLSEMGPFMEDVEEVPYHYRPLVLAEETA